MGKGRKWFTASTTPLVKYRSIINTIGLYLTAYKGSNWLVSTEPDCSLTAKAENIPKLSSTIERI